MKKESIFRGVCTALVTPFRDNVIDFNALESLLERQISAGIQAVAICGTTGENATLSDAEHKRVLRFAIECVNGRIPVIAGTGSNDTNHAVDMSKYACDIGADALLIVSPYYNKASQAGLIKSYTTIADSVNKPIILYNVPTRTCVDIDPKTYEALKDHPNIAAIKEASPSVAKSIHTLHLCGSSLDLYAGSDELTLPLLAIGGAGVISVVSNLVPEAMCRLYHAFEEGNIKEAAKRQTDLYRLMSAMFLDISPVPLKYALSLMGLCQEDVRLPLCSMSRENKQTIQSLLKSYHLISSDQ
ncbi:MAG: 4-hydroxy-tetrahydrodipicolinate synthase [Clostridiales bacterium]|nr:4-hydroxy-tetrahydrodipicolinate synthase [Clostridiales bacterium]